MGCLTGLPWFLLSGSDHALPASLHSKFKACPNFLLLLPQGTRQKQLKGTMIPFGSQLESLVHHEEEILVAGA